MFIKKMSFDNLHTRKIKNQFLVNVTTNYMLVFLDMLPCSFKKYLGKVNIIDHFSFSFIQQKFPNAGNLVSPISIVLQNKFRQKFIMIPLCTQHYFTLLHLQLKGWLLIIAMVASTRAAIVLS